MNGSPFDLTLERDGRRYKFYSSLPRGKERERFYRDLAERDNRILLEDASSVFNDRTRTDVSVFFLEPAFDELCEKVRPRVD